MFVRDWCLLGSICVFNLVKGFIMLGFSNFFVFGR